MWQADTFDPEEIDRELGWAEGLGMNTMRVFLHDLPWEQDPAGFQQRIGQFLQIAAKHHIRPLFVLFDSCWDPDPKPGPQHPPVPGVHNSGWVQSPGVAALMDKKQYPQLKAYVTGVVGAFANDPRILGWDLWNEPDNINQGSTNDQKSKRKRVNKLLPKVFKWARSADPSQPLTAGVWNGSAEEYGNHKKWTKTEKIEFKQSDVITFHNYSKPEKFQLQVDALKKLKRPVLCTEYMARPRGSTFAAILPLAKQDHVAAINWGFVLGKTQTNLPWDSWQHPYVKEQPPEWFHDIFYGDGRPYRDSEVELIRQWTGVASNETTGNTAAQ